MVNGELYTIVLNKDARGRKGNIAALIKGTKGKDIAEAITKKVSFLVRLWWIKIKECSVLNLVDFYSSFESTFFRTLHVYINVNNHYEGSAPFTIDKLKGLLQKK